MLQTKKVVFETVLSQQEKFLQRLYKEKKELENALQDKLKQIEIHEDVLKMIKEELE